MACMDTPDARMAFIQEAFLAPSAVGCSLAVIDTAGIVPDSHKGAGLGNGTLDYVLKTDVLFHIIRAFDNDTLSHYDESIDPVRDIITIDQQLIEKDLQTCEAAIQEIEEDVVRGFDGLSNGFRFDTLLSVYACLAGRPYTYQNIVGSIAKKQVVPDKVAEGEKWIVFATP
jgi:hypothetical protein